MNDNKFYFDEKEYKFYIYKDGLSYQDIYNSLSPINDDWTFYEDDGVSVTISKNSKLISFIKDIKKINIFITNAHQVFFLLNKFKFTHYKIDGKNPNEIIIGDNLDFSTIEYLDNLLFREDFDKVDENVKNNTKIFLKNLSLMYFDYQEIKEDSEFILTNERNEFFKYLKALIQQSKFIPICGPKSIGKTTSLLYYLKMNARRKYFYINLKYCKKLLLLGKKEKLYLCICKELYNCMTFEDVKKFYNFIFEKDYIKIMELVYEILKYMNRISPFDKCYFLIDHYKEKTDKNYEILQKIEMQTKITDKFHIIVCSSINEYDYRYSLNKKLENSNQYFLNYLLINKLYYVENEFVEKVLNKNEIKLLNDCGNLFIYYYQIKTNKILEEKPLEKTKNEIKEKIIKEINEFLDIQDYNKKINFIRKMHDYVGKKVKFFDLKHNLCLFPFKYFDILKSDLKMFAIKDLQDNTELIIEPSYPIVIDCINSIFKNCKYQLKINSENEIKTNTNKSEKSFQLKENFNDYLWLYRKSFSLYGCKIIDKIKVSSLLDSNSDEGNVIKEASKGLKIISESILITQTSDRARHYDTAILKLYKIENEEKFFELYLFHEASKRNGDERICNLILIEDKIYLKYRFYLYSNIKIENVYFSYIIDKKDLDNTAINYCKYNNINYQIYDDDSLILTDSNINPLIRPKFDFPLSSETNWDKYKNEYPLEILDINYSLKKEQLKNEENKLQYFLNKKRELKNNEPEVLTSKIKDIKNYVNNSFRYFEIERQLIQEYSMNKIKNEIVGISYVVDNETKKLIKKIQFTVNELSNLKEIMTKYYHDNIDILKIVKLEGIISLNIPDYDCCILQLDKKGEKFFIDLKLNTSYSLKNKKPKTNIELIGDYYLIKFTSTSMISQTH